MSQPVEELDDQPSVVHGAHGDCVSIGCRTTPEQYAVLSIAIQAIDTIIQDRMFASESLTIVRISLVDNDIRLYFSKTARNEPQP